MEYAGSLLPDQFHPVTVKGRPYLVHRYEGPLNKISHAVVLLSYPENAFGQSGALRVFLCSDSSLEDSEYVRNGTCSIFAFIEPLTGKHHVSVREHRTATDWAEEIKYLSDVMYPDAEKIVLVMDNLNTHKPASLYKKLSTSRDQENYPASGGQNLLILPF